MSCCCKTNTSKNIRQECPECGESCLSVTMPTMFHQIQFPVHVKQGTRQGDAASQISAD